ncbi:phage tail tape measure protein [Streptomyces sp. NPDC047315]|uniref:phage tail tape measure protein n=1 Tax=Streptomyces sp. NPDC047315 TaxID=3155142 RepID=UPI0033D35C4B
MAVEVGMGYVSIMPEVRGFSAELQQQITGPADAAGQEAGNQAGQQAGENFTGRMGSVLKGGLAAVAVAAAAVVVAGFTKALEQSGIPGKIQAQLGSTPAVAKRYGKVAGSLYAHGITNSVEDAAQAVSAVMRSGIMPVGATNKQIEDITGKVSNLSSTFELDLAQTANATGQILKTGLAKNGTEALDLMTVAMQKMGPRADDLADTMNEYSTKFRDLGLSGAEAMGLMAQGMASGARDTDTIADALKEFQIRATDGAESSKEAYEAIGLNAEAMTRKIAAGGAGAREGLQQVLDGIKAIKDPAERSAVAVGLFGTKAEDLGLSLYAMDPRTAVKALGDTAGAATKMGDALHSGAGARIEQLKRTAEMALTTFFGDHVIPVMMSTGRAAADYLAPGFQVARSAVGDVANAFRTGGGQEALTAFRDTAVGVGGDIRAALAPSLGEVATGMRAQLLPAFRETWAVIGGQFLPLVGQLTSAMGSALGPVFSAVARIITETLYPALVRIHAEFMANLAPVLAQVSDFISTRAAPALQMMSGKLTDLVQKAQPLISTLATLVTWSVTLASRVGGVVIPVLIRLAGPIFSLLVSAIGTAIGWIANVVGAAGRLGQAFVSAGRWVGSFASGARRQLGDFTGWMKGLPGRIDSAVGDLGTLLRDQGADLARGIWDGIRGMGRWLSDKLMGWAKSTIPGPIAKALGISSPSKVMRDQIGRWLPAGVAEGVDAAQPELDARLRAMVTVPDIRPARAPGVLRSPTVDTTRNVVVELLRAIEADRGDIVVRVGETEIARAVAAGQRQLARR